MRSSPCAWGRSMLSGSPPLSAALPNPLILGGTGAEGRGASGKDRTLACPANTGHPVAQEVGGWRRLGERLAQDRRARHLVVYHVAGAALPRLAAPAVVGQQLGGAHHG